MQANPPFPVFSGQRQLAAVLFTDAVGFSARMHAQEVATLHRMERDLEIMRRLAGEHGGAVLKTTGDGLLVRFGSAVQAVACALEIQHGFATRVSPGNTDEALQHRVGIHLGDIFVNGDDIMGDGVNIAARLVAEAPPGGIIVSQVVHEVVKNKLALRAVPLGARQLKNIREPVTVFRVEPTLPSAPVAAAPARSVPEAPAGAAPPAVEEPVPARPPARRALIVAASMIAALAAGWLLWRLQERHQQELGESQATQAALAELLRQKAAHQPTGAAAPGFDFAAATTSVPARQQQPSPAGEILARAEQEAAAVEAWRETALRAYSRERPLPVRSLGHPAFTGATVFTTPSGQLHVAEGGASRRREWTEWNDAARAAILVALVRAGADLSPRDRSALAAYAFLRGEPEIIAALREFPR